MNPSLLPALLRDRDPRTLATVAEVAAALPGRRPGKRMSARVIERWCRFGAHGQPPLACDWIGGRRVVLWKDVLAFLEAIAKRKSAPKSQDGRRAHRRRERQRELAHRAAEALLR